MSGSDHNNDRNGGGRDSSAAEYVLGLLDSAERQAMSRAIARDPDLAEEVAYWENHLASLNDAYQPVTPPTGTLARVEARLFAGRPRPVKWYDSLVFWRSVAGLSLAAALFGIGLNVMQPAPVVPPAGPSLVTALQPVESDLALVALYDAQSGVLRLTVSGSPAGSGNDYELWFIAQGEAPVSMGLVAPGQGEGIVVAQALQARFGPGITLAVTREMAGGSPDGTPQGAIVSAGVVTIL